MRRAAKIDGNHSAIVSALRQTGCFVQSLAAVGKGCPDLLVARSGCWYVLEVKNGDLPPSQRKLTDDEDGWHMIAKSRGPVHVVHNVVQALQAVGL